MIHSGVGATMLLMSPPRKSAGRPRANDSGSLSGPAREQILNAAAALFSEAGFAGTSTRAIAARVGIRQQSLYSHFAGKEDILAELLKNSVRPSIDFIASVEGRIPNEASAAAALFALASFDTQTLRRAPHNIGALYLIPEIQTPRFDVFRSERTTLRNAYGRLGAAAALPAVSAALAPARLGTVLIQLVEVVIQLRRDNQGAEDDEAVATSCLRVIGLDSVEIIAAREQAQRLLPRPAPASPDASA
jgi:AcrR family transcriptional regulator